MKSLKLKLPEKKWADYSFSEEQLSQISESTRLPSELFPALKSHPIVIFSGKSGSGKTSKARELARAFCNQDMKKSRLFPENFCRIQVTSTWNHSGFLMGFYAENQFKPTEFLQFILKAWKFKDTPFFLCLEDFLQADPNCYLNELFSAKHSKYFDNSNEIYESEPILNTSQLFFNQSQDILGQLNFQELFKSSIDGLSFKEMLQSKGLLLPPNLITILTHDPDKDGEIPESIAQKCWILPFENNLQNQPEAEIQSDSGIILGNITELAHAREAIKSVKSGDFLEKFDQHVEILVGKEPAFTQRLQKQLTIFIATILQNCPSEGDNLDALINKFKKLRKI